MSPASATIDLKGDDKGLNRTLADGEKRVKRYAADVGDTLAKADGKATASSKKLGQARKQGLDQATSGNRAYRDELNKTGQAQTTAFGPGMVGNLAKVALGYVGISQAISLVTRAIADKQEMENRSRDVTITVADAQIKALRNLGVVSDEEREDFVTRMRTLNAETQPAGGLPTIFAAASSGLSSSFGNVDATEAAIRASARIAPESAEEIEGITKALLHLGKATGTMDAEKNLGFMLGVSGQAAVTSPKLVAQNLVPAIIGVTGKGGTAQEAGAIVAAMTQGLADAVGAMSGTAAISIASQLKAFLPEEDLFKFSADGQRELDVAATGLASTLERIRFLQETPLAREEFLSKASFEQKAGTPIEQMLTGGEAPTALALESALKNIPKAADSAAIARDMIRGVNMPFEQGVAAGQRAMDSIVGQLEGTEIGQARASAGVFSAEQLDKVLSAAGMGYIQRTATAIDRRVSVMTGRTNEQAFKAPVARFARDLVLEAERGRAPAENIEQAQVLLRGIGRTLRGYLGDERVDKLVERGLIEKGPPNAAAGGAFGGGAFEDVDNRISMIRTNPKSDEGWAEEFINQKEEWVQGQADRDLEESQAQAARDLEESLKTPFELLQDKLDVFDRLFQGKAISEDTRGRAIDRAFEEADIPDFDTAPGLESPKTAADFQGIFDRRMEGMATKFFEGAISLDMLDRFRADAGRDLVEGLRGAEEPAQDDRGFQSRFEGISEAYNRISAAAASRPAEDQAVKAAERAAAANEAAAVKAAELLKNEQEVKGVLIEIRDKPPFPGIMA